MDASARVQLLVQGLRAVTFACLFFLPSLAWAAVYGSDGYGGGGFGTGVVPAPPQAAAAPAGGGGVIGGPMSVGYVVSNPTSTIVITTTAQVAPSHVPSPNLPFRHPLQYRDRDPDVRRLQVLLNQAGYAVATTGPGSLGQETDLFGPLTFAAVLRFQEAHAQEILVPLGLVRGTGYFGTATIAFVNAGPF